MLLQLLIVGGEGSLRFFEGRGVIGLGLFEHAQGVLDAVGCEDSGQPFIEPAGELILADVDRAWMETNLIEDRSRD